VDSKAECVQLNLAHVARKEIKNKKLKQTNASAHLVHYRFKIRELEGSLEKLGHLFSLISTLTQFNCSWPQYFQVHRFKD